LSKALTPAGFAREASAGRWECPPHLELLNRKLVELAARRVEGLVVEMPPRHGKTLFGSNWFPAWYLGTFPDHQVILVSHGQDFAEEQSAKVQAIVAEHGKRYFGIEVDPRMTAASRWGIRQHAGGMRAVGIGGQLTGRGADLLVMDDLVRDSEDALSEASRRRNRDWLESTAFTRLEPGGVVVLSNTRWHEQDPAGLILAGEVGSHVRWEELRLPALAEDDDPLGRPPGEALWPARYPRAKLESIRASNEANAGASAYWWDALFQARPLPKSGGMFQAEWFEGANLVTQVPLQADRVRYWDRAASHGKGDYTVGTLMACDGKYWYVEDVIRGRWAEGDRDSIVRHAAESDDARYGRVAVRGEQEPGSSGKDAAAAFVRMLAKHDVLCAPVTGSKETRARAYAAQCQFGNVKFLRGAPWLAEFVREHVGFPRGKHDDQIDSVAGAFNCLCDIGEEFAAAVSGPRRGLA
jgi:predicted phage terminase large subunit-like protein